ncbi:unnamed protein product [Prunus armeniaca]
MTLHRAAHDWFHTLPSRLISYFKELAFFFTNEYTSYRTIKKQADHLFNWRKEHDESLRDYIKRFKVEKANIVGCDDRIAPSAFKKGLLAEHYRSQPNFGRGLLDCETLRTLRQRSNRCK